jgi:hypothetical protein
MLAEGAGAAEGNDAPTPSTIAATTPQTLARAGRMPRTEPPRLRALYPAFGHMIRKALGLGGALQLNREWTRIHTKVGMPKDSRRLDDDRTVTGLPAQLLPDFSRVLVRRFVAEMNRYG